MNQLVVCSYPVKNFQSAKAFYEVLLGIELAPALVDMESYHALVSAGVKLTLNPVQGNQQHAICHFSVPNLDTAIQNLKQLGGKLIAGPFDLPIADAALPAFKEKYQKAGGTQVVGKFMGRGAILADPDGNFVGVVQLAAFGQEAFQRGQLTMQDYADHQAALDAGKKFKGA